MNVLNVNLSIMTQHELLGFLKRVDMIMGAVVAIDDNPMGALRLSFQTAVDYFDEVLKPPTRSEYTKQVKQLRAVRLDQWSGLRNEVRGKCKIADEAISFPAEKASAILDRYGNLRMITSVACDAAIDNILQDIKKEISQDDLKKLNINDWITLLSRTNFEYRNLVETRWESKQGFPPGATLEARKQAVAQYHEFVNDIQFYSRRGTTDEIKETSIRFIESINGLIKEIKPILKSRLTRYQNAKQTPDEPEEDLMEILNEGITPGTDTE